MKRNWRKWPAGPKGLSRFIPALPDGSGALSLAGGYWTTCGDWSVRSSARTGGNWRSRRGMPHPTGCSACCTTIGGMRTWFVMTSGATCWSICPPLTRFWWWTRPASSRKGRSRLGCSGSTAGRRGGSKTVRSGYFWPMPAPGAEPCWTGNCICLKYGLRTGSGGRRPEFREMFPFGPSPG